MSLDTAIESRWALVLARFVTPALAALTLAMGGTIGSLVLSDVREMRVDIVRTLVVQGQHDVRLTEIERRINSRKSPISYSSAIYGRVGMP